MCVCFGAQACTKAQNHVAALLYPWPYVVSVLLFSVVYPCTIDEPSLVSAARPGDIRTIASQILQCLHFLNAMNLTHTDAGLHHGGCFGVAASSGEHRTNRAFTLAVFTRTRSCCMWPKMHRTCSVGSHASLCAKAHFTWSMAQDIKCRNAMLKDSRGERVPFSD